MCVLTYVPTGGSGFILTNNRDENLLRPLAVSPQKYKIGNKAVYFPKDPKAGGTWIATSAEYTLCLLNGAFEKHIPEASYAKSRGQVILDFFKNTNIDFFNAKDQFSGYENFTLIVVEQKAKNILQIVWDGIKTHVEILDFNKPYIWSSSTLYSKNIVEQREWLFRDFISEIAPSDPAQLFAFHRDTKVDTDANHLVMKRPDGTLTQSICQIVHQESITRFYYFDLLRSNEKSLIII
jgi:Transport and Golgi organisation 2